MITNMVVLVGNLVDAPEVSVTQSAAVRARFRLAHTDRRRDPQTEAWVDGDSLFLDVICWRRLAENVGNSLQKGDRVFVTGRLRQWTAERDGVRRVVTEVEADTVGPDLQRGLATIARPRRSWSSGEDPAATAPDAAANAVVDGVSEIGVTDLRGSALHEAGEPDGAGIDAAGVATESRTEPDSDRSLVEVGG